jgi:hypothetical protein
MTTVGKIEQLDHLAAPKLNGTRPDAFNAGALFAAISPTSGFYSRNCFERHAEFETVPHVHEKAGRCASSVGFYPHARAG